MQVKKENGNLVITIPLTKGKLSASGKTLVLATSGGNKETELEIDGKKLTVGVNAYVKA